MISLDKKVELLQDIDYRFSSKKVTFLRFFMKSKQSLRAIYLS